MSWKNALEYAKELADKHGLGGSDNSRNRQDEGLPLGACIGGFVRLQKSPFIRAISAGSLIDMPTDAQSVIKAISRVKLDLSGSLYRYYLQTGERNEKEIFLQVYADSVGEVTEVIYCTGLTRFVPETEEEQHIFMGLSGYGLGDKSYSLSRAQLRDLNYVESDLDVIFGSEETLDYFRDAGNPEDEFVSPFKGSEIRLDDAKGQQGLQLDIFFMPYQRDVKGQKEYLFITTEIINSKNGNAGVHEIHVDFMVGIPVELERVVIQ